MSGMFNDHSNTINAIEGNHQSGLTHTLKIILSYSHILIMKNPVVLRRLPRVLGPHAKLGTSIAFKA